MHTWLNTQAEGWWRLEFDRMGIPYTYISTQVVSRDADLRSKYTCRAVPARCNDTLTISRKRRVEYAFITLERGQKLFATSPADRYPGFG
jgi:hypothetical protein